MSDRCEWCGLYNQDSPNLRRGMRDQCPECHRLYFPVPAKPPSARITELEAEVKELKKLYEMACDHADDSGRYEAKAEARIDAALELLPDLLHTQDCKWQQARPCDCAKGEVRKALTGEKTATAKELIEGTQKLTFKEKDEATGFIPLQIDKTYEEDQ